MAIHAQTLQSGPHISRIHKSNGPRHRNDEVVLQIVGVDNFRWRGYLRAEDLGHPILFKLGFRHLVNHAQDYIAFTGDGSTNEQYYRELGIPVLPLAKKDLAHFAEGEIADGSVGM